MSVGTSGGARPDLAKAPHEVAAMFDRVARRYDLTNDVLSIGQDRRWRRAVLRAVSPRPGERVLDLAAGTGTSSFGLAGHGVAVLACDFSLGMLRAGLERSGGARRAASRSVTFVAGDGLALPFADAAFDVATMSFGLRNVADLDRALAEMYRVVRPGGRLLICEFSAPTWRLWRTVYVEYLMRALPAIARRTSSHPDAYVYLAESIRAWPSQEALAARVRAAGWSTVGWRNLSGGIVALHRATRP